MCVDNWRQCGSIFYLLSIEGPINHRPARKSYWTAFSSETYCRPFAIIMLLTGTCWIFVSCFIFCTRSLASERPGNNSCVCSFLEEIRSFSRVFAVILHLWDPHLENFQWMFPFFVSCFFVNSWPPITSVLRFCWDRPQEIWLILVNAIPRKIDIMT